MTQSRKFYGNNRVYNLLTSSIKAGHITHAYLLTGDEGLGKKTLATEIAALILCESSDNVDYKKAIEHTHPDLYLHSDTSAKDAIHIKDIREIRLDAYIKPNQSNYKVYIIPNAQNMSDGAANAFLKVLEEPPCHTIFILTAKMRSMIKETIVSRCVCYELNELSTKECEVALNELAGCTDYNISLLCNGNIGKGLQLLSKEDSTVAIVGAIVDNIIAKNDYGILVELSKLTANKDRLILVLQGLMQIVKSALVQKSTKTTLDNPLALILTYKSGYGMISIFDDVIDKIRGNININIVPAYIVQQLSSGQ